ncbi:hypothetical protein GCM10010345_36500 [Streptomyces canarius]|uniref:Uncharacterized protein n=1 Tax=Streptomyces canarius TaxID=285453 RepID=A0ABQ3CM28_9ACTN|nr:hypothetical protein GCM10010345_36500 [Streptomyces canarius]
MCPGGPQPCQSTLHRRIQRPGGGFRRREEHRVPAAAGQGGADLGRVWSSGNRFDPRWTWDSTDRHGQRALACEPRLHRRLQWANLMARLAAHDCSTVLIGGSSAQRQRQPTPPTPKARGGGSAKVGYGAGLLPPSARAGTRTPAGAGEGAPGGGRAEWAAGVSPWARMPSAGACRARP